MKVKKTSSKKKALIAGVILVVLLAIILNFESILGLGLNLTMGKEFTQLQGEPIVGEWYAKDIPDAVSSDGTRWQGYIRKGSENKVMVMFFGGGVSVDEFTAARSLDVEGGFYNPRITTGLNVMAHAIAKWGIGNDSKDNPFRDWSIIAIPYNNGDFHAGAGEMQYTALDGTQQTIYYNGYLNYRKMMEEGLKYIGSSPEQVLITGGSAGGFGTAILADDVMSFFPQTEDFTVLVDSSLLITENWNNIMTEVWKSPEKLSEVVKSDNITLDSLVALHQKHGDKVKILFDCSVRDNALARMQTYFDKGGMLSEIGQAEGDRFQMFLSEMVQNMQEKIPGCGIYIWDDVAQKEGHLTAHTGTGTKIFFEDRKEGPALAEWVRNAVNGDVKSYGLELLDKSY